MTLPVSVSNRSLDVSSVCLVTSPVLAGAFVCGGQWARSAAQEALTRLGARLLTSLDVRVAPFVAAIRRMIASVSSGGLADLTGESPDRAESVAADGKSARGSRHDDVPAAHLLAAMTSDGRTVTQLRVPDKTDEITCFARTAGTVHLAGIVVSADALHTQRDHVVFPVEAKRAHYAFTVKKNRPTVHERLRTLPWERAAATFYDRSQDHGRKETRVVRVLTVEDLDFRRRAGHPVPDQPEDRQADP